ncbi:MAG: aldolase catalytic domain-containing protein [Bacilli bacterium]|nr:aldolase catalytic domain-containing protein [Bacilli bacterium]
MRSIQVLDCTLRDGGYVNDWDFGYNNIKRIISNLNESDIDIIECGFIRDKSEKVEKDENHSNYDSFSSLIKYDKKLFKKDKDYCLMLLAETYNVDNLKMRTQNYINTIRLSFHKSDMEKGLAMAKIIKEKGYKLFLQPTATMGYSDDEIIELLKKCNEIMPESVAIVDTFGEMLPNNVVWLTNLFDKYLDKNIKLSFHAHNNLQTAYSNAIIFMNNTSLDRNIVIDSSIYGMGRGAGNLPTELILDYLNKYYDKEYNLLPILNTVDNILLKIKEDNYWGYSLEYYLSAIHHCHPKYGIYFSQNKTLTTSDISTLLDSISDDKRIDFDLDYAQGLYQSFCEKEVDVSDNYDKLIDIIGKKDIILIGPGSSITKEQQKIGDLVNDRKKYFSIAINSNLIFDTNAVFCSNRKRYQELDIDKAKQYIFTSNVISKDTSDLVFDYQECLASEYENSDNSLLMLLNILKQCKLSNKVLLAGFDGFSINHDDNFYKEDILYVIDKNKISELNNLITKYIKFYKKKLNIEFLTKSLYNLENKYD